LWETDSGRELARLLGHKNDVTSVAFLHDEMHAMTSSDDDTLALWDLAKREPIRRFVGHTGDVINFAISPDEKRVVSCGHDTVIRVWDIATGREVGSLIGYKNSVQSVAFSRDGRYVLSGDGHGRHVTLWDAATYKPVRTWEADGAWAKVCFLPDGRFALSASQTVQLWDVTDGHLVRGLPGTGAACWSVAVLPEGHRVLIPGGDGWLRLCDIDTGVNTRSFNGNYSPGPSPVAVSRDGRFALSAGPDNSILLWALPTVESPAGTAVGKPAVPPAASPAGGGGGRSPTSSGSRLDQRPVPPAVTADPRSNPDSFRNSIGMMMKLIPAGEFLMGSPATDKDADGDEKPDHRVRIARPFYLGVHEVTRRQFRRFVDDKRYQTEAVADGQGGRGWNEKVKKLEQNQRYTWQSPGFDQTDEHPVVNVSWNDAVAFTNWLSQKEGKTYRLPTEAEWEYGCRATSTTKYSFGDQPEGLSDVGNVADGTARQRYPDWTWTIAARDGFVYTSPVGRYRPNAWGLHDMHGNVWEWCSDRYNAGYYKQSPGDDPPGSSGAGARVFRGGSWSSSPRVCRSTIRYWDTPDYRSDDLGFRVALNRSETPNSSNNNISSAPTKTAGSNVGPSTSAPKGPSPVVVANRPVTPPARAAEPAKPIPPGPFRVATNGLAGTQFIDPITFGPDWLGFNPPGTAEPWATRDAFARLTSKRATLGYPRLPVSRYVFEVDLTVHTGGSMRFCFGDPLNEAQIGLYWNSGRKMIECTLPEWYHGGWGWSGSRDFAPEHRIGMRLVVGDGRQTLFHEDKPILSASAWPTDCCLRICTDSPDSAVIHRCSLRPLTEQDVAACGWTTPPTNLALNAAEAAARLAKISEGYPARPKAGERFAVKTTGTPMAWIPPGEFDMGSRKPEVRAPLHRVRLTKGHWMAQVEVTQGEFLSVTGANPSRVTGSPYLPVDWVAWDQAVAYCRKLSDLERKNQRLHFFAHPSESCQLTGTASRI